MFFVYVDESTLQKNEHSPSKWAEPQKESSLLTTNFQGQAVNLGKYTIVPWIRHGIYVSFYLTFCSCPTLQLRSKKRRKLPSKRVTQNSQIPWWTRRPRENEWFFQFICHVNTTVDGSEIQLTSWGKGSLSTIIYRVSYIPGGARFQPSTVSPVFKFKPSKTWPVRKI